MKTIKELNDELISVKYDIQHKEMKPAMEKRLRKRIPFLKMCMAYIESNPDHIYIRQEIKNVENKISLRMAQFPLDEYESMEPPMDKPTIRKLKNAHEKKYDIKHLREQVRTLRFLLKS